MPQKTWVVGEEVLAADFNSYVQDQVVPAFPNVAARDAQWTAPPDGALAVTTDTNQLWQRIGGAWAKQGAGQYMGNQYSTADAPMFPNTGYLLQVNFTALAGHNYWCHADVQLGVASGTGGVNVFMRIDNTTEICARSENFGLAAQTLGPTVSLSALVAPSAGPHVIGVLGSASADGCYFQDGNLVVIDVGM